MPPHTDAALPSPHRKSRRQDAPEPPSCCPEEQSLESSKRPNSRRSPDSPYQVSNTGKGLLHRRICPKLVPRRAEARPSCGGHDRTRTTRCAAHRARSVVRGVVARDPGARVRDRAGRQARHGMGDDMVFASGRYRPHTRWGRELLAHELAHVLQQRAGRAHSAAGAALEAEALAAGRTVAGGRPVVLPGLRNVPGAVARPITQHYTVVTTAAQRLALNLQMPGAVGNGPSNPGDAFPGQTKVLNVAARTGTFMNGAVPNLQSTPPATAHLRLSAAGNMAIEHCDSNLRQPKVLYATDAVINESNARLALIGAHYRLLKDVGVGAQQITLPGRVLWRAVPQHIATGTSNLTVQCDQNCNQVVNAVIGSNDLMPRFLAPLAVDPASLYEYEVARNLLPGARPAPMGGAGTALTDSQRNIARPYGQMLQAPTAAFTGAVAGLGVNERAVPGVGEAFLTCSVLAFAPGTVLPPTPGSHTDYSRPADPVFESGAVWSSHFAGVVAQDGTEVMTLENHARTHEVGAHPNSVGLYFQMYDTDPAGAARSWHTMWGTQAPIAHHAPPALPLPPTHEPATFGSKTFTNPLTLVLQARPDFYDTRASALYAAGNLDLIKNDHNLLVAGIDPNTELEHALKGLHYANVHLAADRTGTGSRIDAWIAAVGAARAAPTQLVRTGDTTSPRWTTPCSDCTWCDADASDRPGRGEKRRREKSRGEAACAASMRPPHAPLLTRAVACHSAGRRPGPSGHLSHHLPAEVDLLGFIELLSLVLQ
ncbi:DUF4157 domain-containing protein [Streptomyces sp. NPDC048639]|uniref:eCIS core domain-containing protein n=1 Tax=Streptomyces sp. NPDC048639 TaxID=3365581 RepID=UPI00371B1BB5